MKIKLPKWPGLIPRNYDTKDEYCEFNRRLVTYEKIADMKNTFRREIVCNEFSCHGGDTKNNEKGKRFLRFTLIVQGDLSLMKDDKIRMILPKEIGLEKDY
jgi:hypothetical protein